MIIKSETPTPSAKLDTMTPRQIVEELDRYVIGQRDACLLYTSDAADE